MSYYFRIIDFDRNCIKGYSLDMSYLQVLTKTTNQED